MDGIVFSLSSSSKKTNNRQLIILEKKLIPSSGGKTTKRLYPSQPLLPIFARRLCRRRQLCPLVPERGVDGGAEEVGEDLAHVDEEAPAANHRDELHLGIKVKEISETEKEAQLKKAMFLQL